MGGGSEDPIKTFRRVRKSKDVRTLKSMTPRLEEVKGVGRFSSQRYCDVCGQKTAACRCKVAA